MTRSDFVRMALPGIAVVCPAELLRDANTAWWVRKHGRTVVAHSNSEVALALSAGIKPSRMVGYGDRGQWGPIRGALNAGARQFIVDCGAQVPVLECYARRPQQILVDVNTDNADDAIAAICGSDRLHLVGLHCALDPQSAGPHRYAAAVDAMVARMALIRLRHGLILSRLSLVGPLGVSPEAVAGAIGEATESSCGRCHFPRPSLALTPRLR